MRMAQRGAARTGRDDGSDRGKVRGVEWNGMERKAGSQRARDVEVSRAQAGR
jgi:hypothetical protein